MTDWIDFAVFALFLFALWFYVPTVQTHLAVPLMVDRNEDWVRSHPEQVSRVAGSRWRLWLSYGLGCASLGALTSYQLGLWRPEAGNVDGWMVLWGLSMASMTVALVIGGALGVLAYIRSVRTVPLAPRRQASLARRTLADHVPAFVRYPVYMLVLANIGAWLIAGLLGTYSSPIFWPRVVTMLVLSGIFFGATALTVNRRPNVMDRLFGPAYRRRETRFVFATQLTTPVVGALRLYEEVNAVQLFDASRAMQLLLALFITYGLLRLSGTRLDLAGPAAEPSAVPSAP